jgi:hypothetical protein
LPTDAATQDVAIFWLVVSGRLLLPLLILRFPLPAILLCLVLDGVDQTIYQQFTDLDLTGYQGYDKALDIYYLTIAYLATLRNWTNRFAFEVSRFLLYYRLTGVVLFDLFHWRAPAARLPELLRVLLHRLRGLSPAMGPATAVSEDGPTACRGPAPDHAWRIAADPLPPEVAGPTSREAWIAEHRRLLDRRLLEKIVLVGFLCVIFAQIIPGVDATSVRIFAGTSILITIDSLLGLWTARRSRGISSFAWSFVWLALANEAIVALGQLTRGEAQQPLGNTIFFVLLLTLIVTLYDWYEPYHGVRFEESSDRLGSPRKPEVSLL